MQIVPMHHTQRLCPPWEGGLEALQLKSILLGPRNMENIEDGIDTSQFSQGACGQPKSSISDLEDIGQDTKTEPMKAWKTTCAKRGPLRKGVETVIMMEGKEQRGVIEQFAAHIPPHLAEHTDSSNGVQGEQGNYAVGFLCLSELLSRSEAEYNSVNQPLVGDVAADNKAAATLAKIHLKRSKCRADILQGSTGCSLCPVTAMMEFVKRKFARIFLC